VREGRLRHLRRRPCAADTPLAWGRRARWRAPL